MLKGLQAMQKLNINNIEYKKPVKRFLPTGRIINALRLILLTKCTWACYGNSLLLLACWTMFLGSKRIWARSPNYKSKDPSLRACRIFLRRRRNFGAGPISDWFGQTSANAVSRPASKEGSAKSNLYGNSSEIWTRASRRQAVKHCTLARARSARERKE